jgi:hypothetical protein
MWQTAMLRDTTDGFGKARVKWRFMIFRVSPLKWPKCDPQHSYLLDTGDILCFKGELNGRRK